MPSDYLIEQGQGSNRRLRICDVEDKSEKDFSEHALRADRSLRSAGMRLQTQVHTIRQAVWLFPIASELHVLEELPNFTAWAQRHASPSYTMREYLIVHAVGIDRKSTRLN